jgi:hypothetical protein
MSKLIYNISVNPYDGMSPEQFGIVAEEHYQVTLSPWRKKGAQSDLMYYFNLWHETLRQHRGIRSALCFDEFMTSVQLGKC